MLRYLPLRFWRWRWAKSVMAKRINDVLLSGKQKNSKPNMLKALQDAHEGDRKMSKGELIDEISTLLIAGHETTACGNSLGSSQ